MNRAVVMVCVVALLAAVVATASVARTGGRATVSAPLLGTWGKTMTKAAWHKYDISYEQAGHWAIALTGDGTMMLLSPPGHANDVLTQMSAATAGGSLVVGPTADGFCGEKVGYTWKLSGRTLVIGGGAKDDCTARRVLFTAGTWTKE